MLRYLSWSCWQNQMMIKIQSSVMSEVWKEWMFVGRKSREGEGDGEADGMGGRSEGDGVLT